MTLNLRTIFSFALFMLIVANTAIFAQTQDEAVNELSGKVDGVSDRVTELENTVNGMKKLKISGYVQPQWGWQDVDSLGNQVNSRNAFTIRRGRVKFVQTSGPLSATVYPDITEAGVVMKEVFATWTALYHGAMPELAFSMGAMNRPFGYEIGYSSSSREVTERSLFENRFFNGERDLGFQITYTPSIADINPLIEVGLFNGSDNFAAGPVSGLSGSSNKLGFSSNPIGKIDPYSTAGQADSAFKAQVNAAMSKESTLTLASNGVAIGQAGKEFIGHLRLPFLISDELSFDIGGSLSLGGITEPSDVIGNYNGANGALQLTAAGTSAGHSFTNQNNHFMATNRTIIGGDAQFYLSFLPIGGTIIKGEMYTGQVPFYGSAGLFTASDAATIGAPIASTIYKNVMGFYAMLVQNIGDDFQLALRYETYDPNTDVEGANFAVVDNGVAKTLRGINASSSFGGDLAVTTLTVDANIFISGSMRLMLDWDHPMAEDYVKPSADKTALVEVPDAHDDRFTFRMQYKF